MLSRLYIRNYALIKNLEISLAKKLNIITGETGAGKSILLGALGLLLGNRLETKTLYDENEKCIVEGEFDISNYNLRNLFEEESLDYEDQCIIRREISTGGKGRAFINDTPVTLDSLKKIASKLVDIHSQHDTLLLGSNVYQLDIIDTLAGNRSLLESFKTIYRQYKQADNAYQQLLSSSSAYKKEYDFDKFIFDELEKAKFEAGEQEVLEEELNINEHAEEVKTKLVEANYQLSSSDTSVLSGLYSIVNSINSLAKYSEKYLAFKERLDSCIIELKDIAAELESEEESVQFDPEKIEQLKDRLSLIYSLQKKHNTKSLEDLIALQEELRKKLNKILNLDDEIADALEAKNALFEKAQQQAKELSAARQAIVAETEATLVLLLQNLGMPNASIKIRHNPIELTQTGIDEMKILFSSNKGMLPQDLKNVASGGEFSRLMLALKYVLAEKISLPTIIFDEIDTGVSGEISIRMGRMMKDMAGKHQIIAITHLPQIASQGESQYFVYKDDSLDRTISNIRELSKEERVLEIAKMIGGESPSAIAISNAKELLSYK